MESVTSNIELQRDGLENSNGGGNSDQATQNDRCSLLSLEDDDDEIELSCVSQGFREIESLGTTGPVSQRREVRMASSKGDSKIPEVRFNRCHKEIPSDHPTAESNKVLDSKAVTEVNKSDSLSLEMTDSDSDSTKIHEEKARDETMN